jgi:gamma-glutamylcyclotransferase (GGCT)/AIG2-like uncharacterized protein YtfP
LLSTVPLVPRLFSYGTLQQHDVQLSTFGRLLDGREDQLPAYELSLVRIDDAPIAASRGQTHYANVTYTGRSDTRVSGTAFDVTDAELAAADRYEQRASYSRVAVALASGIHGWVYMHDGTRRDDA